MSKKEESLDSILYALWRDDSGTPHLVRDGLSSVQIEKALNYLRANRPDKTYWSTMYFRGTKPTP